MKLYLDKLQLIENGKINWQRVGLLSGYAFFVLMIFAKAIGLDSSNKAYYVFAAIAAIFWGVECLFHKFSKQQFIFSAVLMLISFATVVAVRKPGFVLTMMAVVALRNMDREKLLKMYLYVWSVGLVVVAILVSTGVVEDATRIDERGYFRHGAGFCTGNCYHSAFVILFGLYFYYRRSKSRWWEVVIAECLNVAVFYFSGSLTGIIMGFGIPIAMYVVSKIDSFLINNDKWKLFNVYVGVLCVLMICVVLISFVWPMINKDHIVNGIFYTFSGRLFFIHLAQRGYPIRLFGFKDGWLMLDNAYVYIFYQFGVIPFILVISMFVTAITSLIKKRDIYALTLIAIFVAYGFMEQFFNAAFMNFTWIMVGCELMNEIVPRIGSKAKE